MNKSLTTNFFEKAKISLKLNILVGKGTTLVLFGSIFGLSGCATIAPYDQVSYEHATSLKAETLALFDKANEPYSEHKKDIDAFNLDFAKAYEYDKGRPLDNITVKMWDDIRLTIDYDLNSWKKSGTLSPTYIEDIKSGSGQTQLSGEFDQIIELESGKNKN